MYAQGIPFGSGTYWSENGDRITMYADITPAHFSWRRIGRWDYEICGTLQDGTYTSFFGTPGFGGSAFTLKRCMRKAWDILDKYEEESYARRRATKRDET